MMYAWTNKKPTHQNLLLDDRRRFVVPDITTIIGDAAITELAAVCDVHAEDIPPPLPEIDGDPVQHVLDNAVASAP